MKKFLSVILSLVFVFSLPLTSIAAPVEPENAEEIMDVLGWEPVESVPDGVVPLTFDTVEEMIAYVENPSVGADKSSAQTEAPVIARRSDYYSYEHVRRNVYNDFGQGSIDAYVEWTGWRSDYEDYVQPISVDRSYCLRRNALNMELEEYEFDFTMNRDSIDVEVWGIVTLYISAGGMTYAQEDTFEDSYTIAE